MPDWTAFGAVAGLVLALVLGLARVTTATMTADADDATVADGASVTTTDGDLATDPDGDGASSSVGSGARPSAEPGDDEHAEQTPPAAGRLDETGGTASSADSATETPSGGDTDGPRCHGDDTDGPWVHGDGQLRSGHGDGLHSIPTTALLVNVVLTHGVLAAVLLGAAALTAVPATALGVTPAPWSTGLPAVLGGVALGGALALANGALAANLGRFGIDYSDALRTALTPHSKLGWVALLGVILPLVSLFEELLFRGVLVGAAAAATGLSPWPFVVLSSIAFAMGHGLQGRGGILVTGSLGGVLAAAFVLTESLLLVIVAHYVVNAAEFLLHEWLGVDVHGRLGV